MYVEKPFVETREEADTLFALARERGRLICAGHQLLRDPAFCQSIRLHLVEASANITAAAEVTASLFR